MTLHQPPRMGRMELFAQCVTTWVGTSLAFVLAGLLTLGWLISGPIFGFTDTWQLVMNTISSIVTFLMVFLIQRSQNKDTMALQLKMNELVASMRGASNRLVSVEDLSEEEVRRLHERYQQLAEELRRQPDHLKQVSIEQELRQPRGQDRPAA